MAKYILNVTTLEELKHTYKKLALIHHPDCGGDEEIMKVLNNEYEELFEQLKNKHTNKDGVYYEKETEETPKEWQELIDKLLSLKMIGVVIEVIGSFLWISGNTKPYKEQLGKGGLGMKWSPKKQAWYQSPKNYRRYGKKDFNMNDIRQMYGSQQFKEKKIQQIGN